MRERQDLRLPGWILGKDSVVSALLYEQALQEGQKCVIPSCREDAFGRCLHSQLISESYNNSHNRVKITPQGGVTIFGVNITPKRSNFLL